MSKTKNRKNPRSCDVYLLAVCNGALEMVHGFKFDIFEFHFPNANPPFSVNLHNDEINCFSCTKPDGRYNKESNARSIGGFIMEDDLFRILQKFAKAHQALQTQRFEMTKSLATISKLFKPYESLRTEVPQAVGHPVVSVQPSIYVLPRQRK